MRVGCLFFFIISLKTLFLARRVKTRACHPAYVCAHIKPEGLSGLSSYARCEADVAALHTVCRPELCNAFASAAGPPGGDSRELRPSLSFLSAFLVVFLSPVVSFIVFASEIKMLKGAPHCLRSALWVVVRVLGENGGLQLAGSAVLLVECEGWSGRRGG